MILYRLKLILFTGLCVFTTTQAAGGAELPQELIDCRALSSAVARLDCYDQAVDAHTDSTSHASEAGAARQAEPAAVAPAATAAAAEPADNISPEALFGKNLVEMQESVQAATGTKEIDQIEALVSKVGSTATGKAVITLDNGQVWTQIDNTKLRLSDYDQVIIRRAFLGSFMLNKVGSKTSMRVKRIS